MATITAICPLSNKKSKKDKIREKSINIVTSSTIHGLPNILRSNNYYIITIWSICFAASFCVCSYFVVKNILDYLRYEKVTTISVINENKCLFPTVSVCAYPNVLNSTNFIKYIRFDRNDINKSNFKYILEEFIDPNYGKCYRINSGRNMLNKTYDLLYSTSSDLPYDLRFDVYLDVINEFDSTDLYVSIHNHSLPPIEMYNSAYWLSTGNFYFFQVERVFTEQLEEPYNNCLKDINTFEKNKTIIKHILNLKRTYTQKDCFYFCSNLYALEESNCSCNSSLEQFTKICLRKPQDEWDNIKRCIADYLAKFRREYQYEYCYEYCPLECDSISYEIIPYSQSLLIDDMEKNVSIVRAALYRQNFSSYKELKRHYLAVNIYYKNLKYDLIMQEPKIELFVFISNIGGILGLFLGISFLSFIEILEILVESIYILYSK